MKVPPKRKGNTSGTDDYPWAGQPSMKVPPKRKGNGIDFAQVIGVYLTLNESPSEKEGK